MKAFSLLTALLLLLNCGRPAPTPVQAASEPEPIAVTRWSPRTELFFEYPPLVVGQVSRFAIHVTRLDNFRAVTRGAVQVSLQAGNAAPLNFRADAPSRPGIFGVDVTPAQAGSARLQIHFQGEGIEDIYDLGEVNIASSPAAVIPSEEPSADEGAITFLKEQQWSFDFATALVQSQSLPASLRVPAEVEVRSGGRAQVLAPFSGQVHFTLPLAAGMTLRAQQPLAELQLPTSQANDPSALILARQEAQAALELATKDLTRARRLAEAGAAPQKRFDEALATHATATARLQAAEARLAQWEATRAATGQGASAFVLRSPMNGVLAAVHAASGANVTAGQAILEVADLDTVYVAAIVPESEYPGIRSLRGAELEIPGQTQPRRLSRLVQIGSIVDASTRTFPVLYEFDNRARLIALNQTVYVRLLFAPSSPSPVVPEAALVDDSGQPLVFVQLGGESFARRSVRLGSSAGGMVQILSGLEPGERVVVEGAHLIRLASLSSQAPAHGHVH